MSSSSLSRSITSRAVRAVVLLIAAALVVLAPRLASADTDHHDTDHHATSAVHDDHASPSSPHDTQAPADHDEAAIDPELDIDMHGAPPATDKAAYAAFLRSALAKVRPRVVSKLEDKMLAGQSTSMNRLSAGLFFFSLLGVFLLFRPLFLAKRFPGQGITLFKYSAISAGLFFLTVNLFAMVIGVLKTAQGAAGHFTNPQIAVVEAAFDVLDKNADDLVEVGPKLIEPSMHELAKGDASFVVVLLENFKGIKSDIDAILAIAKLMKALDGVFALLPAFLTVIAIVTFALSAKDTLLAIVRLPETAVASGGAGVVIRGALRRVKNELLATLCLVGCLIVLAIGGGVALRAAVEPAVESLLNTVFLAAVYIQVEKVSSVVLFGGLALSALVLVLNIGVVMAASSAALGKLHKIFQRKFHEGLPLRAHGRFWKRAPFAVLLCFVFPFVYDLLAEKGVEAFVHKTLTSTEHPSYGAALIGSPLVVVIGFVVCFGVVLGGHAMVFLFRYPVKSIALAPQEALSGPVPVAFMQMQTRERRESPRPSQPEPSLDVFDRLVSPASSRFGVAPTVDMKLVVPAPVQTPAQVPMTTMPSPQHPLHPKSDAPPIASTGTPTKLSPQEPLPKVPPAPESDVAKTTVFRRSGIRPLASHVAEAPPSSYLPSNADDTIQMPSLFVPPEPGTAARRA